MDNLINKKNLDKILFTPGPASLSKANLINLNPAFGRGDKKYLKTEKKVLSKIKKISGHKNILKFSIELRIYQVQNLEKKFKKH